MVSNFTLHDLSITDGHWQFKREREHRARDACENDNWTKEVSGCDVKFIPLEGTASVSLINETLV